jgi:hypothetical protein
VGRILKIIALSIAVTAFTLLAVFGFAIWVFIPVLPAAIIFGIAVYTERHESRDHRDHQDHRKAA